MGRSDIDDPKLAEVKAILARLQRMSPDDAPEDRIGAAALIVRPPAPITPSRPALAPSAPPLAPPVVEVEPATPSKARLLAALLAGAAVAALLLFVMRPYWLPPAAPDADSDAKSPAKAAAAAPATTVPAVAAPAALPRSTAPTEAVTEKAVLQLAERLIRSGSIIAGRSELLRNRPEASTDLSWALARAFDPTVVGRIENADAAPDIEEAAKWYRQWHALAVQQGLVADSVSIDRMIRAMRP